jgi:hypothetical protein
MVITMIFNGNYQFKGSYADKVNRLTGPFNKANNRLFARMLDVYILAPIVGFLYNRTALQETGGSPANVLYEQISKELGTLWFNYRLIMLLDERYEPDFEKRVSKAFRDYGKEQAQPDEEHYEEYVRGGVDVLYEKLIEQSNKEEDYLNNLHALMEEINERYGQSSDEIIDLCRLARA